MINFWLFWVGVLFLLIIAWLDVATFNKRKGFIPSFLTSAFLIVAFLVGWSSNGVQVVVFGVLGGLLSLLFTDLDVWGGLADLKVFIACSLLFGSVFGVLCFGLSVVLLGLLLKWVVKTYFKEYKRVPFVTVIMVAFILVGMII
jgi:hypothetical protein